MVRLDVPKELQRGRHRSDEAWRASAIELLELLARSFGRTDLSDADVLDVGCGTKFTKVMLEEGLPIRRYVGVDSSAAIVDFLTSAVDDPRFAFHHLDAHNDLYNPGGLPLASFDRLPLGPELFDIICLFSVFTHLSPTDYRAMLKVLRPHVAPGGGLIFSLFVDARMTPEVRQAINQEVKRRRDAGDPEVLSAIEARLSSADPDRIDEVPPFVDRVPDRPMLEAVYSEAYARELIEGTGWAAVSLHPPQPPVIQHYFICRPT